MEYALITGAYGGMGRATVTALKNAGYFVFALDKRVGEAEENVLPIPYDATDLDSVEKAFQTVREHTDKLSVIVHFAGIYVLDSLVEIDEEAFQRAFDINVFGVYRVNKVFLPLLQKGSKIIVTTSELAPLDPLPFTGLYAVTKSALDKYAYSLRMELQLLGISVTVFRSGAVETDLLGVSTSALDRFCANTQLYTCNAERFKRVVNGVEARSVPPEKVAKKVLKIVGKRRPKYVYTLNRNPLLLLLNVLPAKWQTSIIKRILR
jgi:NAD(P)-dependent dehydrogenase (short-subunit alcohol dehydrogenase family)